MTKVIPRKVVIELQTADVVGADGNAIPIGQGHFELRLRSRAMVGLRVLLRGMEHTGDETLRRFARHKSTVIEYLLTMVADAYDALPAADAKSPKVSKVSKESKESKTDNI